MCRPTLKVCHVLPKLPRPPPAVCPTLVTLKMSPIQRVMSFGRKVLLSCAAAVSVWLMLQTRKGFTSSFCPMRDYNLLPANPNGPCILAPPPVGYATRDTSSSGYPQNVHIQSKGDNFWKGWCVSSLLKFSFCF
ncbi:hypothetical protein SLEP1_g45115 [Rubroshorea leprosula]|uniref:Uncharacterized protein n=1 Tax=Rubroshorea leprosula TaxID=152421 RepID=A0AAV5LJP6_9ROSI|nr:hypothetical protein SLEP1_g45115 [Rubroshorea leprosula]